jgi:hypothetical protein
MTWNEVVDSAIDAGAIVSVKSEGRVLCYADGKHVLTLIS